MHKVDPIQIMLSDIFDKVFYRMAQSTTKCPDCDGVGWYEADYPKPQNFDRDVGYLDTKRVKCEWCGGTGRLEVEE